MPGQSMSSKLAPIMVSLLHHVPTDFSFDDDTKTTMRGPRPARFYARAQTGLLLAALMAMAGCGARPDVAPSAPCPPVEATAPAPAQSAAEVMVVATIHGKHLSQPLYPLTWLGKIIEERRPDLVLVEIRPEPFAQGLLEDGPIEMAYITQFARSKGIKVDAIDWWRDKDLLAPPPTLSDEEKAGFERDMASVRPLRIQSPSFAQANMRDQDSVILAVKNAEARYAGSQSIWNQRQAWMNHRAAEAIRRHSAKNVLVFVGQDHRPELCQYLEASGSRLVEPSVLSARLESVPSEEAPAEIVAAWRDGVTRLEARMEASEGIVKERLRAKIRSFQMAIESKGKCCVKL